MKPIGQTVIQFNFGVLPTVLKPFLMHNFASVRDITTCTKVDKQLAAYLFINVKWCNDVYNKVAYIMTKSYLLTPKMRFQSKFNVF